MFLDGLYSQGVRIMNVNKKVIFVCFLVLGFCCALYGFFSHSDLKKQCGVGMDCRCFANVVDNRLSRKQIRGFTKFLGEIKKHPTANILEFLDEDDAKSLSRVLSVCRLDNSNNHVADGHGLTNRNK